MENVAVPASNVVSPQIFGYNADLKPEAFDPEGAKKLLAEAGYPSGFAITVSAPNDRYVNDDQVAQAVAQMLSRIGIRCAVEAMPFNVYLTKARDQQFSFAMLGWGSYAADLALRALLMTPECRQGQRRVELGALFEPQGRQVDRTGARHRGRKETRSAGARSRRRGCRRTSASFRCITRS